MRRRAVLAFRLEAGRSTLPPLSDFKQYSIILQVNHPANLIQGKVKLVLSECTTFNTFAPEAPPHAPLGERIVRIHQTPGCFNIASTL